ncbi:MAG: glycosyltransferase family 9 protein [Verrucomicrobiae bacterium]|jgi:ADP-heptose:LPS heptosyltransferase|nr:glycosyltransferase family 9 protein [Verrucomicrobiae bacterium]
MWNKITRFFNEHFFRLLASVFPPVPWPLPKNPKLILVFSTTGIGDSLFDSAAIKSLKKGYPQSKLIVAAHHRRGAVARHHPFVDEVLPLSKSPLSQFKLLRHFRNSKPDLVVALHVNEEAVPLGYLLNRHAFFGAVERCQRFSFLLSHPVVTKDEPHIVKEILKVATAAGGAKVDRGMVYQVREEEVKLLYQHHPALKQPFIIFQTGGGKTLSWRNWPVESYIHAIRWFKERYPHQIILTGGHDNYEVGIAIEKATPWVINLVQKTTLEETAALLKEASMLVSTDTGVMHLGFAVGCPTLALLHYRSPTSMYGPLDNTPGHEIIELAKPEKELLLKQKDPQLSEMSQISFEKVFDAMERILHFKK